MSVITINEKRKIFIDKNDDVWIVEKVSMYVKGRTRRKMFWVADSIDMNKKGTYDSLVTNVINHLKENYGESKSSLKITKPKPI